MSPAGLAVFVFLAFLVPVPILAWLDRPRSPRSQERAVYAGHFAAGLALEGRVPTAPTWGLLVGVGLLDLLFGPFVLAGVERASLTPGVSPGFLLDYIDPT